MHELCGTVQLGCLKRELERVESERDRAREECRQCALDYISALHSQFLTSTNAPDDKACC